MRQEFFSEFESFYTSVFDTGVAPYTMANEERSLLIHMSTITSGKTAYSGVSFFCIFLV